MARPTFTSRDVAYITGNYVTLDELCARRPETPAEVEALIAARRLPRPAYVLHDGTAMFPKDYFRLPDEAGGIDALPGQFVARHRAAVRAAWKRHLPDATEDWHEYLNGTYGICLREVTPEAIVRKTLLVSSLCELLMLPRPRNREWRAALRDQVSELDALESDFTPDHDRSEEHDRPPTRDLLITAARERYPDVFSGASLRRSAPT